MNTHITTMLSEPNHLQVPQGSEELLVRLQQAESTLRIVSRLNIGPAAQHIIDTYFERVDQPLAVEAAKQQHEENPQA